MRFLRLRSYTYFARDDLQKKRLIPPPETLVFPKWEPETGLLQTRSRFRAHYRECGLCLLRADVTKTGNFSVENFPEGAFEVSVRPASVAARQRKRVV